MDPQNIPKTPPEVFGCLGLLRGGLLKNHHDDKRAKTW